MRAAFLLALALAIPLTAYSAPPADALVRPNFNSLYYPTWKGDLDRNGMDDRLDAAIAAGATGTVFAFVHYDRRPTEADAAVLTAAGAVRAYAMHNWDDVYGEFPYSSLPEVRTKAGVVAVELFDLPQPDLEISTRALRVYGDPNTPGYEVGAADEGPHGEGMVVAVIDSGIENAHESLDDLDDDPATDDPKMLRKVDPVTGAVLWGAVDASLVVPVGCVDPRDVKGHGTSVAGIVAGTGGPTHLRRGVAPAARILDVAIALPSAHPLSGGAGIPTGLDWILDFNAGLTCYGPPGDDRIDLATMSYSTATGPFRDNADYVLNRMITDVVRSGITFVQSAGNSADASQLGEPSCGCSREKTLGAGAEGAIIVGNVDIARTVLRDDDSIVGASSRGPRTPDGDADTFDELRPDVSAPGANTFAPDDRDLDGYTPFGGTSAAAPHVAGVALLILQLAPTLRPVDLGSNEAMGAEGAVPVRDILQKTAEPRTAGATPPQYAQTGRFGHPWNNAWGYGEVDALAALLEAAS